jgi:hypothetical protein
MQIAFEILDTNGSSLYAKSPHRSFGIFFDSGINGFDRGFFDSTAVKSMTDTVGRARGMIYQ